MNSDTLYAFLEDLTDIINSYETIHNDFLSVEITVNSVTYIYDGEKFVIKNKSQPVPYA